MMNAAKPIPPNTRLHEKIKHLTLDEQKEVVAILRQLAPKHNMEIMKEKARKG